MNVCFCNKTTFPITRCNLHMHSTWEVIYQLSGTNRSPIGEKTYEIRPGDIMFIPPGTSHGGLSDGEYNDMFLQAAEIDFHDITVLHDYDGSILTLFDMLHRAFWQKGNNYSQICDTLLEAICQYAGKYTIEAYRHPFIYKLQNYLYENIANSGFRASDISSFLGYNIDYIRRCFYTETGKTPLEYLTDLRISLAKKLLLQETFVSIKDVAFRCGFADSFYFSTLFRKKTGMAPTQYRKESL